MNILLDENAINTHTVIILTVMRVCLHAQQEDILITTMCESYWWLTGYLLSPMTVLNMPFVHIHRFADVPVITNVVFKV